MIEIKFTGKVLILTVGILVGVTISSVMFDSFKSTKDNLPAEKIQAYEDILEDYSEQLRNATSKLIEGLEDEREAHKDDYSELAALTHEKILELAVINNEGTLKIADLMRERGDSDGDYVHWALKLTDVYMKEAEKLADVGGVSYNR